jgi:mRNA interferase RelE/StbE
VTNYSVVLTASAEKDLYDFPEKIVERIMSRIESLEQTPRPLGYKKLKGSSREWCIRIGDYRVVYAIDDKSKLVDVIRIAHRREVYD